MNLTRYARHMGLIERGGAMRRHPLYFGAIDRGLNDMTEYIAILAVIAQTFTLALLFKARADARAHKDMFFAALDMAREQARNSVQRDPKTGRYASNRAKVIEL